MRKILIFITLIIFVFQVNAQNHNCGVGIADGFLIKQRMLDNRAKFANSNVENLQKKKHEILWERHNSFAFIMLSLKYLWYIQFAQYIRHIVSHKD